MPLHLLSIVGARPQFVKAAMVVEAVRAAVQSGDEAGLKHTFVHTGQHYDPNLSDIFFRQLPLPEPQYNLGVGSGSHGKQTGHLLAAIEQVLVKERPDVVVVYGDTNSTLAAALAASKLNIPVAHIEAGLRSFNRRMAEEINRIVTDHISTFLFCPTETAVKHLAKEGISRGVYQCGDVMLDAVLYFKHIAEQQSSILKQLGVEREQYILFTMHRAENTDSEAQIAAGLDLLIRSRLPVVFPIHPRTRERLAKVSGLKSIADELSAADHVHVVDPVSYLDMLALESNARLVLTDSGGVQKEAYFVGVPCLTFRGETEWTETLEGGWNRLVDADLNKTLPLLHSLWNRNGMQPAGQPNLAAFGGGNAAQEIVRTLVSGQFSSN